LSRHIHIVCLDNPYPADYGGAIDMFYKIKALAEKQIKIHLHYFSYNQRRNHQIIKDYCESVTAYKRNTGLKGLSSRLPYIVSSRINQQLIKNLNKDNFPIILEGLHCSGILDSINKNNRKIILRIHNDEAAYYSNLYKAETNIFRKLYFAFEKYQLKRYQQKLPENILFACISTSESEKFTSKLKLNNSFHLPPFVAWHELNILEGTGSYCLYHGNLAISENEIAAIWLMNIFSKTNFPLLIAGNAPSKKIKQLAEQLSNISLQNNPTVDELNKLIKNAQINILPSFTQTGIKLKLLHALFEGRHCIVNDLMLTGTGLADCCSIANTETELNSIILQLMHRPLSMNEMEKRRLLLQEYDNLLNADKLIQQLYS
jgi:hypothetical protein